ncbi:craniofacial development protein 2 [Biomphalaria glabrata]|nr:craniofacial development protein 2-like [Biomphalaria glabrata]
MHPRSKHWHLLDYIIVRQCDVRGVVHTNAQCRLLHGSSSCPNEAENHHQDGKKKEGLPKAKKLNVERLADARERFSAYYSRLIFESPRTMTQ